MDKWEGEGLIGRAWQSNCILEPLIGHTAAAKNIRPEVNATFFGSRARFGLMINLQRLIVARIGEQPAAKDQVGARSGDLMHLYRENIVARMNQARRNRNSFVDRP